MEPLHPKHFEEEPNLKEMQPREQYYEKEQPNNDQLAWLALRMQQAGMEYIPDDHANPSPSKAKGGRE